MVKILPNGDLVPDDDPRATASQANKSTPNRGAQGGGGVHTGRFNDQETIDRHEGGNRGGGPNMGRQQRVGLIESVNQQLRTFGIPSFNVGEMTIEPIVSVAVLLALLVFGLPGLVVVGVLFLVHHLSSSNSQLGARIGRAIGLTDAGAEQRMPQQKLANATPSHPKNNSITKSMRQQQEGRKAFGGAGVRLGTDMNRLPLHCRQAVLLQRRRLQIPAPLHRRQLSINSFADGFIETFSACTITRYMEPLFTVPHDLLGLDWVYTIMLTSVGIRLATLPFVVVSERLKARRLNHDMYIMKQHMGEMEGLRTEMPSPSKTLREKKVMRNITEQIRLSAVANRLQYSRMSIIGLTPLPIWLCQLFALRNLCGANRQLLWDAEVYSSVGKSVLQPSMAEEGMLWFPNLLVKDSTYGLPLTMAVISVAISQVGVPPPLRTDTPLAVRFSTRSRTILFVCFPLFVIPLLLHLPAAIFVSWCSNLSGTLVINLALQHPNVRRVFRILPTPTDTRTPVRTMLRNAFTSTTQKRAWMDKKRRAEMEGTHTIKVKRRDTLL